MPPTVRSEDEAAVDGAESFSATLKPPAGVRRAGALVASAAVPFDP
jgi:hypothetical protein